MKQLTFLAVAATESEPYGNVIVTIFVILTLFSLIRDILKDK